MTYVIHGATGSQGAPVVAALVAAGKPVTALTRRTDAVVPGADVLSVDLSSVAALTDVYGSADGVFAHLPIGSTAQQLDYARNIVAAVRAARPRRVVFSTSGAPTDILESPAAVAVAGARKQWCAPGCDRPEYYLENLLLPFVTDGVRERDILCYPLRADLRVSWASHLDIADVAAALFEHQSSLVRSRSAVSGGHRTRTGRSFSGYVPNYHHKSSRAL
jgi:uncharacterized protein YbjT (DUF2867 family)